LHDAGTGGLQGGRQAEKQRRSDCASSMKPKTRQSAACGCERDELGIARGMVAMVKRRVASMTSCETA